MTQQQYAIPDFLGEEQVRLPSGGSFRPSGLIAPWMARIAFRVMSQYDDDQNETGWHVREKLGDSGWFSYFYTQGDAAKAADEFFGNENKYGNLNTNWLFTANNSDVLWAKDDSGAKWGQTLSFAVDIQTLHPKAKRKHAFHMIALPAAVHAMARYSGIKVPAYSKGEGDKNVTSAFGSYNLEELLNQDTIFNDEMQLLLVGSTDKGYKDSLLWKRRALLWAALGEEDSTKYLLPGTGNEKYVTKSPALQQCLRIVSHTWARPAWARLVQVQDPRVEAVSKKDNRLSIHVLFDFFRTAEDAKAAAAIDKAAINAEEVADSTTAATEEAPAAAQPAKGNGRQPVAQAAPATAPGGLPAPSGEWANYPTEWAEAMQGLHTQIKGKPKPQQGKAIKAWATENEASEDDVKAALAVLSKA